MWALKLTWRFFTGLHMDGKIRKGATRGSVLPRYSGYFWNRYTRRRRAVWRNGVFWSLIGAAYGLLFDRHVTEYVLMAAAPFAVYIVFVKVVDIFTQVVKFTDNDGISAPYRILRPTIHKWIRNHKPARIRMSLPDNGPVPPEIARAMMAENAEDNGEPIMSMRLPLSIPEANDEKQPKGKGRNPYRRTK